MGKQILTWLGLGLLLLSQQVDAANLTTVSNITTSVDSVIPFVLRRPDAVAGIGGGIMALGFTLMLVLGIVCGGGGGGGEATPIAVTPAAPAKRGGGQFMSG